MSFYDLLVSRYEINKQRGYQKFYMAIDLHDTVIHGSKSAREILEFVSPDCRETLKGLSLIDDVVLIAWTSTYIERWVSVIEPWFKNEDINFKYFNSNPECVSNSYSSFKYKFYFDIGLDDKFGFEISEWRSVYEFMRYLKQQKGIPW